MSGTPEPSSDAVRRRFENQLTSGTKPEMALRRVLHRRGLRYRVDRRVLPDFRRSADLVFGPAKVAVFVDGCFWHRCPVHFVLPKSNTNWWRAKIDRNVERDRDTDRHLHEAGWATLRYWEHQLREDPSVCADEVQRIVDRRRPT